MKKTKTSGWVSNIERYTLHDGPGIRTTVFLKGCPLECRWCSNPEMKVGTPQLAYFEDRCINCLRCIDSCPQSAIFPSSDSAKVEIDFLKCDHCGECVAACNVDALVMIGERLSAEEVVEQVARDKVFYEHSGGGVTISGGDPLWQPDFTGEILRLCKENHIHTAIQTCAYGSQEQIDMILPSLDLAIVDLKHVDNARHIELTGKGNGVIFDNIKYIDKAGIPIVVQVPLIPGINDSETVLKRIFEFAGSLKQTLGVSLLAFHTLGVPKYKLIGKSYSLPAIDPPPQGYLRGKIESCKKFGVPIIQFMDEEIV